MTDDEIIKALECCDFTDIKACEECPLYNTFDCSFVIIDKTLDLVNRQKAEIERLKQESKEKERKINESIVSERTYEGTIEKSELLEWWEQYKRERGYL